MAKKNNKASQQPLSPERYIRTRVRQLPIYKCYKNFKSDDTNSMLLAVSRLHPQGNITFGMYLLDRWCLGIKEAFWIFNVDKSELRKRLSYFDSGVSEDSVEISYVEAHNWIYGALNWAEEAGIKPHKEFDLAQYLLEPDDENVELIEYDFGKDGEYCLRVESELEASKYIPTLKENLGEGNFKVMINGRYVSDQEESETKGFLGGFKTVPQMEYSYVGGEYPKSIDLHHKEVKRIVDKDLEHISDEDIEYVMSLPSDTLREDLHNLIMHQIGVQRRVIDYSASSVVHWPTISNCFMFLVKVGTKDATLPVVLEVLRQDDDILEYNFGDISDTLLYPILYSLCKNEPSLLLPFLMEEGPSAYGKIWVLEFLLRMATNLPEIREEMLSMIKTLLEAYLEDLPHRSICDGSVVAFAIMIPMDLNATEFLPIVEELYGTGLVDEAVCGHLEDVKRDFGRPHLHRELPATDPYEIRADYVRFVSRRK